jgi:hypothetical protein
VLCRHNAKRGIQESDPVLILYMYEGHQYLVLQYDCEKLAYVALLVWYRYDVCTYTSTRTLWTSVNAPVSRRQSLTHTTRAYEQHGYNVGT